MANKKITELNELTTVVGSDVLPIVDISANETKKATADSLKSYITADNTAAIATKAGKNRRVRKSISIQLDTPTNPVIAAGASHTYVIDLGETFDQLVLTNFQWVAPKNNPTDPELVVANAMFPRARYGGALVVNKTPGSWTRGFEMEVAEFQSGGLSDVEAPLSATSDDVDAPLGYGSSRLQVPLDHIAIQTTPPKKLQIEDVYLDGQNLKVTIKNHDSTSIDLSSYVGVTALFDEDRNANMGAVAENGVLAYSSYDASSVRISEDGGKTFSTSFMSLNNNSDSTSVIQRTSSMAATSDSVNTFIGLFNYAYVKVAQSPDYAFQNRFWVQSLGESFNPTFAKAVSMNEPVGGKLFDWKKTDTESCALFAGFMNYYAIRVYKSVDDCFTFGANSPDFNDSLPVFNSDGIETNDLPDFAASRTPSGSLDYVKAQVKVIDEETHYLALSYWAKDELFYNGLPSNDLFIGPQTIVGEESIPFELRANEVAFVRASYPTSSFGRFKITGSTLGNNLESTTAGTPLSSPMEIYYIGLQTVGAESVDIAADEMAIKKDDWDTHTTFTIGANTYSAVVGDNIQSTFTQNSTMIFGLRDATIDGVLFKLVRVGRIQDGQPVQLFNYGADSNSGSPIPGVFAQFSLGVRNYNINGKQYWVFPGNENTFTAEASELANPVGGNVNLKHYFQMLTGTQKNILLKSTNGGGSWESVNEDPEFRYSPSSIFYSSNDGQTLMLAAMKYWTGVSYEKWPYATNPSNMGADARFNISIDGGDTWRNASGAWDNMATGLINVSMNTGGPSYSGRPPGGQIMGKIGDEILAILLNDDQKPVLIRSVDNGMTWSSKIILREPFGGTGGGFNAFSPDSKDQFMAFFGHFYQKNLDQYLYFGSVVDKFTQWKSFGVIE
jgi:hypothetical protein